jgi:hypothetical protein
MGLIVVCLMLIGAALWNLQGRIPTQRAVSFQPAPAKPAETETDTVAEPLQLETATGVVSGRLFDFDTDSGLSEKIIHAVPKGTLDLPRKKTATDAEGRYQFAALHAGDYEIYYDAINGYPLWASWQDKKTVSVSPDTPLMGVDFPVSKGLTISGTVVRMNGDPAGVVQVNGSSPTGKDSQTSNEDGTFELYGFNPRSQVTVRAMGVDNILDPATVYIRNQSITDLQVMVGVGATISGTLLNAGGKPFPDRTLYFADNGGPKPRQPTATTQKEGQFSFEHLFPGTYPIQLIQNGKRLPEVDPVLGTITVEDGQHLAGLEFTVTAAIETPVTISGRLVNDIQQPLPGANLMAVPATRGFGSVTPKQSTTNDDGTFLFQHLGEGVYNIYLSADGHVSRQVDGINSDSELGDVVIDREGTIRGTVIAKDTRQPISEFRVALKYDHFQHSRDTYKHFNHWKGKFSIPDGKVRAIANRRGESIPFTLWVKAKGYADTSVQIAEMAPGEESDDIVVAMEVSNRIHGTVVNGNDEPLKDARIAKGTWEDQSGFVSDDQTDSNGQFVLHDYPRGPQTFTVFKKGFGSKIISVNVDRTDTKVRVVMQNGARLWATVTLDGEPVPATLYGNYRNSATGRRINDGFFVAEKADSPIIVPDLPAGSGDLRVLITERALSADHRLNSRSIVKPITLVAGETTEVQFAFESDGGSLEGYLTVDRQAPTEGRVHFYLGDQHGSALADANGFYTIKGLPSGQYKLHVIFDESNNGPNTTTRRSKYVSGFLAKGENKQVNVTFGSGADIHVIVTNSPTNASKDVFVIDETIVLPAKMEFIDYERLSQMSVANGNAISSYVELTDIEPGRYQIVVVARTQDLLNSSGSIEFVTQPITIRDRKVYEAKISF